MSDDKLWTAADLAAFLQLKPATIITLLSRAPDRLPPRVAVLSSPRWVPGVVQQWVLKHSGDKKNKGGRPRGS